MITDGPRHACGPARHGAPRCPGATDPTAQVIHDCFDADGQLVRSRRARCCAGSATLLFRRQGLESGGRAEDPGSTWWRATPTRTAAQTPIGRSGRAGVAQAYSIDAVNEFDPLFGDVYDYCEQMELNVDTLIHEIGAGQMEINFFHAHPLGLADEVFFFKRTLRGWSRCATTCSPPSWPNRSPASRAARCTSTRAWSNRRRAATSSATRTARPPRSSSGTSAGCRSTMPAAMALFAPYVNFRTAAWCAPTPRRSTSSGAPTSRTAGIRAPVGGRGAPRVENRVIGADANPYAALGRDAGLRLPGHQNRIEPTPECKGDAYLSIFSCRAASTRRSAGPPEQRPGDGARAILRHRLYRVKGHRVRRVHEGDLALGARAPAAHV